MMPSRWPARSYARRWRRSTSPARRRRWSGCSACLPLARTTVSSTGLPRAISSVGYAEIELPPLSEDASMELAARLLGLGDQHGQGATALALPATLHGLLERAAGTPLWLEELVRTLIERGLLVAEAGGWRLTDD